MLLLDFVKLCRFHTSQPTGINGLCKHGVIILNAFLKCSLYLECCVTLLDVVAFGVHERIHSGLGGVSEDWGGTDEGASASWGCG